MFQDEEQGLTRAHIEAHRENHEPLAADNRAKRTSSSARLNLIVIGSGSKGNASVVYDRVTGEGVLIDAGICKRDVFAFSAEGGFDMAKLKGVLISHNHSDHVKNLGVILRGLRSQGIEVPLYLHPETLAASKELKQAQDSNEIIFFEAGQKHTIGALDVSILPTSHDAPASFAFKFECEPMRLDSSPIWCSPKRSKACAGCASSVLSPITMSRCSKRDPIRAC